MTAFLKLDKIRWKTSKSIHSPRAALCRGPVLTQHWSMSRLFLLVIALVFAFGTHAGVAESSEAALLREWRAGFLDLPGATFRAHKFETLQNVYEVIMGRNPSRWPGGDHSVEMVSWDDAVAFCEKVTVRLREAKLIEAGEEVRLPTEAEWEQLCRAGTKTAYSFGDDALDLGDYCWYTANAAGNDPPAGAKKPNPWGLFDVHGYVWEWCADQLGDERPIRGGAWTSKAADCRSDSRQSIHREARVPDVGFRCVLAKARKQ